MGALNDIFSGRHYLSDGSHIDLLLDQGVESQPDQYATQLTLFEGSSLPSTPKVHSWEPPTDIDPAKRTPHPDPNTDLAQKTHWNNRWSVRNVFRDHLAEHDMPDEDKSAFMSNIHDTLSAIPAGATARLARGLKGAKFYPDTASLGRDLVAHEHAIELGRRAMRSTPPPFELQSSPHSDYLGTEGASGHGPTARYDANNRMVQLPILRDIVKTKLAGKVTPSQVYLHELAHAVDHSPDAAPGTDLYDEGASLSESPDWYKVYREEMLKGRLNKYASTNGKEAFAEFARLVWTNPAVAKTHFPQAYAFFEANDLIDPEDAVRQVPKSLRPNIPKRLRVPTQETTV